MAPPLQPVRRQSVSDAVYEQLRDHIVSGVMTPGSPLPAERVLCEALGVNRGAVREALKRLQQSRLVSVRHGGSSQVLDFRATAGLDLLGVLLIDTAGRFDLAVVRGVIEMRSALAPDIARRAAERARPAHLHALDATVAAMQRAAGDLPALQAHAAEFWSHLVDASDNLAYRLAYNSLRATYDRCRELLLHVLATEIGDARPYAAIAAAVAARAADRAAALARELIGRGEQAIAAAISQLDAKENSDERTGDPSRRRTRSRRHAQRRR
jgi:GntR family transcriptional repressor for pyruvate dehydrogenase complex